MESLTFTGNSEYITSNSYNLYKRKSNAFGNTWGSKIDKGGVISGSDGTNTVITFSNGLTISSFSQFILSNNNKVSVEDVEEENIPIIYPNPIEEGSMLSIIMPSHWTQSTMIVYNMMGQKINQASLSPGTNILKLNISAGMYNVVIFNSEHKFTEKLILV